jgi:predicted Zn-dependent protease
VPDPDALALAARAQLLSGDAKAAEASLAGAARLKPEDVRIRTSLALLRAGKGNADATLRELESIAAGDARGIGDLALFNARLNRGQIDGALKAADALGAKQPDQPMPDYLRGGIALQRGDPAGARKHFEAALAKQPGFVPAVTMLAEMDLAEGKPSARARYESLIKLDPANPRVRMLLAELVARTGGSQDEVAKLLGDAVQANPAAPAARIALIDLYLGAGDAKRALEAAKSAVAALPDNVDLLDRLGRAQMAVGEVSQAIVTFTRLKALLPKAAWPYLRLAEAYLAKGDLPAQSAAVRQAMELEPRSLLAQRAGVMVAQQEKDPTKALAIARTVQAQRPEEPMGYAMEGEIQLSEKRYDLAATAFRNALTKPESSGLAARLHLAFVRAQKGDEAARFADSWRKDHPDDSAFVVHLGDLAAGSGDLTGAEARYREVLARQPDHVLALNNLAFALIKANKPEALPLAERAVKLAPRLPQALDTLAMAHAAQGQPDKAIEWQRKAVELAPQSAELRQRLVELYQRVGDKERAREELESLARIRQGPSGRFEPAPARAPDPAQRADSQAARGGWLGLLTVPAWVTGAAPILVVAVPALVGVIVLVALVVAAFKPAVFRVERSIVVNAPARRIFDLLQDFHQWTGWSVWNAFAPSATRRMVGAATGVRAYFEWTSADKREAGHMEIREAAAPGLVAIEMQRSRPKQETLLVEFVLSPGGDGGTVVRSVARGQAHYGARVVGVLWSRERRLGGQLKANLAGLKAAAEAAAEAAPSAPPGDHGRAPQASA